MSDLGPRRVRERKYAPDKDFTHNSSMTLTLEIKPWFKETAHPFFKDTLWVKYEQNWVKRREYMFQMSDDPNNGWTASPCGAGPSS